MRRGAGTGMPDREKVIEALMCCQYSSKSHCDGCPYFNGGLCETNDCTADLASDAIALLMKEQETKHPVCEKCGKEIDHINTSVFNYDGSDSDYSIPITYSKENGCVLFSLSQNWTGYELTDEEQKERIRCPYCGKFPFNDSIEIEFYEPVEVMMRTSEGR